MHRLLSILTILAVSASVFAQNTVDYWFDLQTQRRVLSGMQISTDGLSTGMHFAYFQIVGADGKLSPVRSKAFLVMDEPLTPSSDYNKISYWFDHQTNHMTLNGNEISTEGLTTGIHFVHLQIEGTDGKLSPVQSQAFLVINESLTPSSAYSAINYWFDRQTARTAYTSGDIDCSELTTGIHAIHFQLIDANGKPCPVQTQFFINLGTEAYSLYYWFDDATEHQMMDEADTEISVEGLSYGHHTLHVMIGDAKERAITPEIESADFVIVCPDDEHVDANADGICDACGELFYYTRATTAGRYGTVCLPKGATSTGITGATIYSIAGKRVDDGGELTSLVLEETSDMEAGKPYIFRATGSELKVVYTGEAVEEASADKGLVGSFEYMSVAEGMYLISNNQVVKCGGTDCAIPANRAYINIAEVAQYTEGSVPPSRVAVIGFEGTTTIKGITLDGETPVQHNVSGIRVPYGTKGIVIVNGKKVVNK